MYKQILITPKPLSTEFAQSWLKWSPSDKKICILQYVCHYKPFFILSWIVKHFNMMLQINNWNSFWHLLMMIEISLQWRFTGKRYELAMCCTVAPLPMKIKFLTLLTCPRNRLKKELSTSWLIISTLKLQCTRDDLRKNGFRQPRFYKLNISWTNPVNCFSHLKTYWWCRFTQFHTRLCLINNLCFESCWEREEAWNILVACTELGHFASTLVMMHSQIICYREKEWKM